MRKWLRRLRGAVGMGLTWAVAWFGLGAVFGLAAFDLTGAAFLYNALASAAAGVIGGTSFSVVLAIAEGRRRFDQMSVPRFALWGAVGGCLVAGLQLGAFALLGSGPGPLVFLGIQGLIGAGSAAGSLILARASDDQELLEAGDRVAAIGLTEDEKRQLLGAEPSG